MIKKTAIVLLAILAILLVKDKPRSLSEFLHIEKARMIRTVKSQWYTIKAHISPIDRDASLHVYLSEVRFHQQEHALSCEIASLKMALSYYGLDIPEKDLISELRIDTAGPRQKGNIWGDPEKGFVGSLDGQMPNSGYGVYEEPVAEVANKYRPSKPVKKALLEDILNAVAEKHPVVVWVPLPGTYDISWKTPEGNVVSAMYGEHARVLIGFSGTINDPKDLFFLDPVYGQMRVSKKEFVKSWNMLDNRAVIVE